MEVAIRDVDWEELGFGYCVSFVLFVYVFGCTFGGCEFLFVVVVIVW